MYSTAGTGASYWVITSAVPLTTMMDEKSGLKLMSYPGGGGVVCAPKSLQLYTTTRFAPHTFTVEVSDLLLGRVGKVDALDRGAHLGCSKQGLRAVVKQGCL